MPVIPLFSYALKSDGADNNLRRLKSDINIYRTRYNGQMMKQNINRLP